MKKHEINQLLAKQYGVQESIITESTRFDDDLGADSLDSIEMVMMFEEEFDVEIPEAICDRWETVGDVYRYFEDVE